MSPLRLLIHTEAESYKMKVESSINYYPNILNYIPTNPSNYSLIILLMGSHDPDRAETAQAPLTLHVPIIQRYFIKETEGGVFIDTHTECAGTWRREHNLQVSGVQEIPKMIFKFLGPKTSQLRRD